MAKIEFENIEPVSGGLFTKDGEKVMDILQIKEVNIETNSKYEYNKSYQSSLLTERNSSMSIEIDNQTLGTDLLKQMGVDMSRMPDKCDIEFMKPVQARKHHKKRINKKWLKRYGCKMINVQSKGWEVKHHTNGTFEFSKKGGYEELADN